MKTFGLVLLVLLMLTAIAGCEVSCDIGDTSQDDTQGYGDVSTDTEPAQEVHVMNYESPELGVAVKYPSNWIYEEADNLVTFSGAEGTDEYYSTLTVQNLLEGGEGYPDIQSVYDDMKGQLKGAGGSILSVEEDVYIISGKECPIIHFEGLYDTETETNRQITTIIEREDQDVFHMITYSAPEELFDSNFNTALNIINSVELL